MKSEFKNLPSGWKVVKLGEIAEKSILKNKFIRLYDIKNIFNI